MKGGVAGANVIVNTGASAGFRLSGRVTDENGAPPEGVLVGNGQIPAAKFLGAWTDSNGRYTIVNVNVSSNFDLSAFQFGYTFANTSWSNPMLPTNSMGGLDFVGTALPTVNIFADTNVVAEADGSAHTFTIARTGSTNADLLVNLVLDGSATPGSDYSMTPNLATTNNITIPAGTNSVTVVFHVVNDGTVEGPETVALTLLDDSGSNGVFRVTRTGDPKYDFIARVAFGVDYPPFGTNIYFTCGVTPPNEVVVEGDESVTASLLPGAAYSILPPSNAVLTIADAGTNATPLVVITSPKSYVAFLNGTNAGLVLNATVMDDGTNDVFTWTKVTGPNSYVFGDSNALNTTVLFTNSGVYLLRLTADDGQLQSHADLLVFVSDNVLSATNILHWTLDEGSGTNVADTSGNGRNGTFSGSPNWITNGAIAGAVKFSGTNDCVRQSAGSNTLNGLKAFTVALWIKTPATNVSQGFLTADDASVAAASATRMNSAPSPANSLSRAPATRMK